ncbi:hypothetical protein GOODEAATRI_022204, partial [Goodea atripinnis]
LLSGCGSVMAAGGTSVPPQLGDVEEDASQLLFPKGDKDQHNTPRSAPGLCSAATKPNLSCLL